MRPRFNSNAELANCLQDVNDAISEDMVKAKEVCVFLTTGVTILGSQFLGYIFGGVKQSISSYNQNLSVVNGFKVGAAEGFNRWGDKAKQYTFIPKAVGTLSGIASGLAIGTVHGAGRFFVNKCTKSRPKPSSKQLAAKNYIEMEMQESEILNRPIGPKRYI